MSAGKFGFLSVVGSLFAGFASLPAFATPVALDSASAAATLSQGAIHEPATSVNGSIVDQQGWAVLSAGQTDPQTVAWETVSNVGSGLTQLTFQLHHNFLVDNVDFPLNLGRFRISATTDNRNDFADGNANGGDVSANWTVLNPISASAVFATLTELGDNSVLASGANIEGGEIYTLVALTNLTGITGFRLEVMADASLPTNGPGRAPMDGNFVLSEFVVDAVAVPEPASVTSAIVASVLAMAGLRRRRS